MTGKSREALTGLETRYNLDLTYLLKRLDSMDAVILNQELLLTKIALAFSEFATSQPARSNPSVAVAGNCRVLQFSPKRSK